jgi:uncharacterized protein YgiM (DUF1202 family)
MKKLRKRLLSLGLSLMISASVLSAATVQVLAYTETTGTVSTDNVKVRSSASTTASQVSSLKNGDKVDIVDEATDASGYVWFKIRVNKSEYGYVRSDLVAKAGGASSTTTTTTTQANAAAASLPATTATATEERIGTITEESVNVRQGAGTAYDSVGKVTKGETVTITGEATGTDNKTWYQVTFGSSNKQGYIRSDLLQAGEAVSSEGAEGEGQEMAEGEGEVAEGGEEGGEDSESQQDAAGSEAGDGTYSLVYLNDEEGNGVWYLYDNVEGYRVKVNELIDAAKSSDEVNKLIKTNNNYKTILIILAVVIAALVIGLIIMALKLRDSLYYEEEEEEEYDRYSQPARRRAREDDGEEEQRPRAARPAAESRTVRPARAEEERPVRRAPEERAARPVRREEEQDERTVRPRRPVAAEPAEERPVRRAPEERTARPVRRAEAEDERPVRRPSYRPAEEAPRAKEEPRRKARNFIGDDDDFEFEFLDLDEDK